MPLWSRKKPEAPPAPPPLPEIEQLAELIPERDPQEHFLWQDYVERIVERFEGLPAPDGGESLVRACLAAGCKAVPVIRLSPLWEKGLSEREWHRRESSDLAARVRLGLFFAASLRYLVHALCRLRIKTGKVQWHPLMDLLRAGEVYWRPLLGGGVSFRGLQAASDDTMEITWLDVVPTHAQVCTLAPRFLQAYEVSLLTLELAVDVLACAQPGSPVACSAACCSMKGRSRRSEWTWRACAWRRCGNWRGPGACGLTATRATCVRHPGAVFPGGAGGGGRAHQGASAPRPQFYSPGDLPGLGRCWLPSRHCAGSQAAYPLGQAQVTGVAGAVRRTRPGHRPHSPVGRANAAWLP